MKNNVEGFGSNCDPADEARANDEEWRRSDYDCMDALSKWYVPSGEKISECCPDEDRFRGDTRLNHMGPEIATAGIQSFFRQWKRPA